jgi:hypothetical protein
MRSLAPCPLPNQRQGKARHQKPVPHIGPGFIPAGSSTMENAERAVSQRVAAGAGLMVFLFGVGLTAALIFVIAVWMPA